MSFYSCGEKVIVKNLPATPQHIVDYNKYTKSKIQRSIDKKKVTQHAINPAFIECEWQILIRISKCRLFVQVNVANIFALPIINNLNFSDTQIGMNESERLRICIANLKEEEEKKNKYACHD